jgi:hypothetical protein
MRKLRLQATVFFKFGVALLLVALTTLSISEDQKYDTPQGDKQQNAQAARARCNASGSCVAESRYTATITDVLESDTPFSHQVRLILRFENLSDRPIILAYRAHSVFLLDNYKNRFFCCKSDTAPDVSAVGLGTDVAGKVDPQLVLKPHESEIATFDLWRHREPDLQAFYYDFDLKIDEIDPGSKYTVLKSPYLSFRDLVPRARRQSESSGGQ